MSTFRQTALVGLVASAVFIAGCGSDDERTAATTTTPTTTPKPAATARPSTGVDLKPFLLRKDEEPGFHPVGPTQLMVGTSALAGAGFPSADIRRMRRQGFVQTAIQPIESDENSGVIAVDLYETAEGAKAILRHDSSRSAIDATGVTFRRSFDVPGVPGAYGWTGLDIHGNRIGHVFWVQGRCYFVLGNEGSGSFVGPLSTGVKAVHARTKGRCPE